MSLRCKTCFSELNDDFVYCPYCGEPSGRGNDEFQYKLNIEEARAFIILGRYDDALIIYEDLMTDEPKDVYCLVGLVRVASRNYTVYDDPSVGERISQLNAILRGEDISDFDGEYAAYIAERESYLAAQEKKRRENSERLEREEAARREKEERERKEKERRLAEERAEAERREKERRLAEERAAAERERKEKERRLAEERAAAERERKEKERRESKLSLEERRRAAIAAGMDIDGTVLTKYKGGRAEVNIPSFVTAIGARAFEHDSAAKHIVIPASVTSIAPDAFAFNGNIESLTVEAGNSVYRSKDNCIIESASKTLLIGCKTSVIPTDGSVTSIATYAFWGNNKMERISIPDTVTSIGQFAFAGCYVLSEIDIPKSVKSIGTHAFYCCSKLKNVYIPAGLKYGKDTFPDSAKIIKK